VGSNDFGYDDVNGLLDLDLLKEAGFLDFFSSEIKFIVGVITDDDAYLLYNLKILYNQTISFRLVDDKIFSSSRYFATVRLDIVIPLSFLK